MPLRRSPLFALLITGALALGGTVLAADTPHGAAGADWPSVGGDPGAMRYSALTQINRENVRQLRPAWTYHTGDAEPARKSTLECTPVVRDGLMYITSVKAHVIALDPATGHPAWRFDPDTAGHRSGMIVANGVSRGVAYWSDGKQRRVLFGTPDGRLVSLDARTGLLDPAFGDAGVVDLRAGTDRDLSRLPYGVTSAPAIYEDLVILGFSCGEGPSPSSPGDIRAFDVRTGKQRWIFHTVPRPGEHGHETWKGDSWKDRGGVNPWSGLTVDARRGVIFAGLGSASFDFYGGDRKGDNLFANCTLALDARTGKRLWHYQTLRHDLWDHDLPYPPVVVTVRHDGRTVEAVAQVTKTGYVWLLDRRTGKPLFPVEERSVPASDIPGEVSAAKQPLPLRPPPFVKQGFGLDDVSDIDPETHAQLLERIKKLRLGPAFTPPSMEGTVVLPGLHGGATWSGASFDPTTGLLYVNGNNMPNLVQLVQAKPNAGYPYAFGGYNQFKDQNGYPAVKPPWGTLNAIDLNRGEIAWQVVLGEFPELKAKGIPQTGTESFGGTIVTAGGLVFIAGTMDEKLHAFDKQTGKLLWEYQLPFGGYATPSTYSVNGKQYVVIATGGGGKLGTKSGDAYVAFALP